MRLDLFHHAGLDRTGRPDIEPHQIDRPACVDAPRLPSIYGRPHVVAELLELTEEWVSRAHTDDEQMAVFDLHALNSLSSLGCGCRLRPVDDEDVPIASVNIFVREFVYTVDGEKHA